MKSLTLFIFAYFLICSFEIKSQQGDLENKLSNLKGLERVPLLIKLGEKSAATNPRKGLLYIEEAIELSKKNKLKSELAKSYFTAGGIFFDLGYSDSAVVFYEMSLNIYQELKDTIQIANTLSNMGISYFYSSDYKKAYEFYIKANKLFKDPIRLANNYVNIGNVKMMMGEVDTSIVLFNSALEIYRKKRDSSGLSQVFLCIGDNELNKGGYYKAIENYNYSLSISLSKGNRAMIASCYSKLGLAHWNIGNLTESLDYYLKSLIISEELSDKNGMAQSQVMIGIINSNMSNYDNALEHYNKALNLYNESSNKRGIFYTYSNMSDLYLKRNEYGKAIELCLKCSEILNEIGDINGYAWNLLTLGTIEGKMSQDKKALQTFKEAIDIFKKIDDKKGIAEAALNIGIIQNKMGNHNGSLLSLKTALKTANEINSRSLIQQIYEKLSNAYESLGNYKAALDFQKKSIEMKDKLMDDETRKKLTLKEVNYEIERKESETNSKWSKQLAIRDMENEKQKLTKKFIIIALILVALLAFFIYTRYRIKRKSNILLEKQNELITGQNVEILNQKDRIDVSLRNVKMLSEIGQSITSKLTAESIIGTVYDNVITLMNSTVFGIGIHNPVLNRLEFRGAKELDETLPFFYYDLNDENRLASYCFNQQKEIFISDYLLEYSKYIKVAIEPKAGKNTESILYLPLNTQEKRVGVITVQSFEKNAYTEYHLDILKNLSIYVAIALDNAGAYQRIENQNIDIEAKNQALNMQAEEIKEKNEQLIKLNDSKDRYLHLLKTELNHAAEYIKSLIPPPLKTGLLKTNWLYIPSAEVGGDSLGYHWIDEDNFAIYLIDVSGHGVGPALHTVSVLNSLRNQSLPDVNYCCPEEVLSGLNKQYKMERYNEKFFTIWYGVYNKDRKILNYAGAGHPPPYIITREDNGMLIECQNILIGFLPEYNYKSHSLEINKPSRIYIYSDGVFEIEKKGGGFWPVDEMYEFLKRASLLTNGSDISSLYDYVREISGKEVLDDDFSILELIIE
jgi:serine phosphatase RsbU (regulator of sigma subunit)/TPR repeat protein